MRDAPRAGRRMPSLWRIVSYWEPLGTFPVSLESPHCFACFATRRIPAGATSPGARWQAAGLERAHLVDRILGGLDNASNLVPLCAFCHFHMPSFGPQSGAQAIRWVQDGGAWPPMMEKFLTLAGSLTGGAMTAGRFADLAAEITHVPRSAFEDVLTRYGLLQPEMAEIAWKQEPPGSLS